jgi:hypothetical protein
MSQISKAGLRLSYVGLGNIGLPVARNLASYNPGLQLKVWNRSKDKYALIPEARGVEFISDLLTEARVDALGSRQSSELTLTRHVVFTSLASDQAALDVYGQLIKAASKLEPGSQVILVDQSTLHPDTASECYPVYSAADTAVGNTLMIRRYRKTSARGECECQDLVPHLPSYGSACRRSCQVDGMHSCW